MVALGLAALLGGIVSLVAALDVGADAEIVTVQLAGGIPFVSDADLEKALDDAGVPAAEASAVLEENESARIAGLRHAAGS